MTQSPKVLVNNFDLRKKAPRKIGGFCGGAKRDRTADLYNAIVALSQLSYGPFF